MLFRCRHRYRKTGLDLFSELDRASVDRDIDVDLGMEIDVNTDTDEDTDEERMRINTKI